ncbi:beta-hydroxyacid dehydrogenase, 3-hydroxyisobutyrate dehydrogenase [Caldisphaera lagunensis DSM 15908]|uniref:Beta-hydroxyacid dehydrogenase, 3-hydroxyisobutyrate dehydrogenase n=1 Tax=Caldisphaera lagunensis (strain DSM 15908 / JCM 11604 / ANMR 0165 / IC-154) TaxID=1056495 RepID=L0ACR3_CALLD|nr:NAD(P)-dependent oxidoreductase [Caldisphaera lagunensis]AFZ71214.1 beta-hydroxyacid dehydrogenase, 3-hydroxyisobutyrate dehydrogenase [Caldisphaera lagunensis DSM 15908]
MKIGLIGLGVMGYRVAANLKNSNMLDYVYNKTESKAIDFSKKYNVTYLKNLTDLAKNSDFIITVLSDDYAVSSVIKEILPYLKNKILVDLSTISPTTSINLSEQVASNGGIMFDAPMIGTSVDVEQKRITIIVGGPKEKFDIVKDVLSNTSNKVIYAGKNGTGLYIKLAANMMFASFMSGLAEAVSFAEKAGISKEQITELFLNISSTRSPASNLKLPKMLNSDFETQFALKHMRKDTEIMVRESQNLKMPLPLTSLISNLLRISEGLGLGELDVSSIIEFYRKTRQ